MKWVDRGGYKEPENLYMKQNNDGQHIYAAYITCGQHVYEADVMIGSTFMRQKRYLIACKYIRTNG